MADLKKKSSGEGLGVPAGIGLEIEKRGTDSCRRAHFNVRPAGV